MWCGTVYFLRYWGQLVSAWLTVAITIERFISVTYPLRANRISTLRTTHVAVASIYIVGAAITCFPYWTLQIDKSEHFPWCGYANRKEFETWNWITIRTVTLILPSVIILTFTGFIIRSLQKIVRCRKELMQKTTANVKKAVLERQLTFMLIAVSVTFLALRLPYMLMYYVFNYRHELFGYPVDIWTSHRLRVAMDTCDVMSTVNYAINFFLYCLTGSQFRTNLYLFTRCQSKRLSSGYRYQLANRSIANIAALRSRSNSSLSTITSNNAARFHMRRTSEVMNHRRMSQLAIPSKV